MVNMRHIAVFASGNGTNYEAIAQACQDGVIPAEVSLLVCDHPDAFVLQRAKRFGTPTLVFNPKDYASKADYETIIADRLDQAQVELVCLAGYMRLIGDVLLQRYRGRIINIHPSLLPAFKGKDAVEQAMAYGVKVYGVTIHYVDESLDGGKIIAQRSYAYEGQDIAEAHRLGQQIEYALYVETINRLLAKKTVLVIGGGGREHAIVYALSRSPQVGKIYCAPGNAGIAQLAECVDIADTAVDQLLAFAQAHRVDLTVVGPEASLAVGIVDAFRQAGLAIFGHTQAATQIESSKEFAKILMSRHHIPTAAYASFADYDQALAYVRQRNMYPAVLKYDGLAAGKGVVIAQNEAEAQAALADMLVGEAFGKGKVVIEEYLEGPEFSFMAFVHHHKVYPMPLSQDHKRVGDGDKGPNTGGMGAYTPLPFISADEQQWALTHILQPIADAMVEDGKPLTGVLYGGLMKTKDGIRVIEFNARFGDPETEVVLPLLQTDAYTVFHAIATGEDLAPLAWKQQATVGVVLASCGYPGVYTKGAEITGVDLFDGLVLHMGTALKEGKLVTKGGRVLMCIACGDDIRQAQHKVYEQIQKIHCNNLFYRKDIAHWAL